MSAARPLDAVARAYKGLRQALGWMGLALPTLLLVLPGFLSVPNEPYRSSISAHYFAPNLGALFAGTLCAIGVFLIYYPGHPPQPKVWMIRPLRNRLGEALRHRLTDNVVTTIAGVSAIGTALVPTTLDGRCQVVPPVAGAETWCSEHAHLVFAGLFLGALAYMALVQFTQSDEPPEMWDREKKLSNLVYEVCGSVMVVCLVLILVHYSGFGPLTFTAHPVFLLEALAVWAFAFSWLVKGDAVTDAVRRVAGAPPAR